MVIFTLDQVTTATEGNILKKKAEVFSKVITDTRLVEAGSLFVALGGERFDGHDFVRAAMEKGAAGILVSRAYTKDELSSLTVTVIEVPDTLKAYQNLAKAYRSSFDLPVIAITGSNGKTTTKDLTATVLGSRFEVLKTEANYNNEIGLPLTLFGLKPAHEVAVVEMGMRGLGQIKALADIALPTIGIVTNVGETHVELLGSIENIAAAKSELVEAIAKAGIVILNADDPYVLAMRAKAKGKVVTFGCAKDADVKASAIETVGQMTNFTCTLDGEQHDFALPMAGHHNVYNALAAIAAGRELGLSIGELQAGVAHVVAAKMRLEMSKVGAYTVINDAYNASPMSMAAAIATLAEVAPGRKVAVLGDMLELGSAAEDAHTKTGVDLAGKNVAAVITVGAMAKYIAIAACANGVKQAVACSSHQEAADALKKVLQAGDTILFKGSRGMQMEKVISLL